MAQIKLRKQLLFGNEHTQPVFMETCGIFVAAKHHCAKALPLALIFINYLSVRIFSLVWLNNLTFLLLRPAYLQQTILLVRSPIPKVNYMEMSQVAFHPSEHCLLQATFRGFHLVLFGSGKQVNTNMNCELPFKAWNAKRAKSWKEVWSLYLLSFRDDILCVFGKLIASWWRTVLTRPWKWWNQRY